jgi:nascent polypeptide-associated complex subunit beta
MPGQFDPAKLQKFLKAKSADSGARVGGKGTTRRKHKAVRKSATHDDKRLKATLSKLNVRDIPAIEEVNLFKDDGHVIHFAAPKVQASIAANTYVVSGNAETKKLQDLLPGIINQLGPDNLEDLKKIYASYKGEGGGLPNLAGLTGAGAAADDDDDMPELVENFEEVAAKAAPAKAAAPVAAAPVKAAEPVKVAEPKKADKKQSKKEEPVAKAAEPVVAKKEEVKPAVVAAPVATPASPKIEAKKAPKAAETPKEAAPKKVEAAKTPAAAAPAKAETPKPAAKAAPAKAETPAKVEAKKDAPAKSTPKAYGAKK